MSTGKHVEDSNKHVIVENVRQFGYLPELYEDARSEKYFKKSNLSYLCLEGLRKTLKELV